MRDGSEGCNFGESCCVTHGVECGLAGGVCETILHNSCPEDYEPTPIGDWGELQCRTTEACCRPLPAGCESVGVDLSCSSGYTLCPEGLGRCCINPDDCPVFDPDWDGDGEPGSELCVDEKSINTAIGCIPVANTNEFIKFIIRWGIGVGGGIAFILILVAGFQVTTSSGDPKRLQAGKELLSSAIVGLLLLIFSAFILRLIGVDIFGLPEFGG